jgi:ribosome-associated protein
LAVYSGSNIGDDGDRGGELLRVRHRQLDLADAEPLGALAQPPGQPHGRLRTAGDLDLAPGEVDGNAEAERLADRFLAGEPRRVVLSRVRARVAVRPLGVREAARAKVRVARERPPHPVDLDQVDAYTHLPTPPIARIDAIAGESSANRIQVTRGVSIARSEILFRTSRSSGPGGQHAQKSETRVEALFDVEASPSLTDAQKQRVIARAGPIVKAVAEDERSQLRNRELALERLLAGLREALRMRRPRRPTRPHRGAVEERLAAKRRRSEVKRLRRPAADE